MSKIRFPGIINVILKCTLVGIYNLKKLFLLWSEMPFNARVILGRKTLNKIADHCCRRLELRGVVVYCFLLTYTLRSLPYRVFLRPGTALYLRYHNV
jgi:hypothetical protein